MGDADAIGRAVDGAAEPLGEAEVEVLLGRLKTAVERGETALFLALVKVLGRSRSPRAHGALVGLLADVATPLPAGASHAFATALLESDVPGIADAARIRFDAAAKSGEPAASASSWLHLVAAHGAATDVEWVLAASPEHRNAAMSYVASAKSPEAMDAYRRFLRAHPEDPDALRWLYVHGRSHPASGYELAAELLGRCTPDSPPRDVSVLLTAGNTVEPSRLGELRAFLDPLCDPAHGYAALYAVEAVRARGLDLEIFRPLVEAPTRFIESVGPGTELRQIETATSAIAHQRVTWSERTVRALERAADACRGDEARADTVASLERLAREIRGHLASRWK